MFFFKIAVLTILSIFALYNFLTNPVNKIRSDSTLGVYEKGAVTSNGWECAHIGTSILKKGGSAVDAAIATLICDGVSAFPSMGLGGGFTMVIYDASRNKAEFLNAREAAPAAATKNMFKGDPQLSFKGGLSVAVPGELLGYVEAHKKYGKLPWKDLFQPSIELCESGSNVTSHTYFQLKQAEKYIRAEPGLSFLIDHETNQLIKIGTKLKRPKLAKTLKRLADAKNPAETFYKEMATDFVKEIHVAGGIITKKDFESYTVKWSEPVTAELGDLTIFTSKPPGSGSLLVFMLNVLKKLVTDVDDEAILWQRIIETFKWGYAKRSELGDLDSSVSKNQIENVLKDLLSEEYANKVRNEIKDDITYNDPNHYGAQYEIKEDHGTGHISVLAPDGSAVAVTSTINQILGSKLVSESTGIIFNNQMDDFSSPNIINSYGLRYAPINCIEPGKRPLSSTTPTIVVDKDKKVKLVIGGAGGSRITCSVIIVMIYNLFRNYNIKEAIDVPRLYHQLLPMQVSYEAQVSKDILNYLEKVGHKISTYIVMNSSITAISKENGKILANGDYRWLASQDGF